MIALHILGAWLFADFLSGVGHWAQDRMLNRSENKFWNSVIDDNVLHHSNPAAMLKFSIFENIRVSVTALWPLTIILFLIHAPTVIWLGIFFTSLANGVHWFSHQRKVNPVIKFLQKTGFFCSFDHHKAHHTSKGRLITRDVSEEKYCVMTDWVNPVLDAIKFFPFLEMVFKRSQQPDGNVEEAIRNSLLKSSRAVTTMQTHSVISPTSPSV